MAAAPSLHSSNQELSDARFSPPELLRAIRTEEGKKLGSSLKGKVVLDATFLRAFRNDVVLASLKVIEDSRELIEAWPESFRLKIYVTTYDGDYSCSHTVYTALSYVDSEGKKQTVTDTLKNDGLAKDLSERISLISRLASLL